MFGPVVSRIALGVSLYVHYIAFFLVPNEFALFGRILLSSLWGTRHACRTFLRKRISSFRRFPESLRGP
jgi:hypothetical protein